VYQATEMKEPSALLDHASTESVAVELPIDRPRSSGFVLHEIDVPAALAVLDSFLEEDEVEQRDTLEYLKQALNETRAAQSERTLFPNE
jgi:hypothetical protein